MYKAQLEWKPVAILLLLALIWGANMGIIKIGGRELAPLFMAGLRSMVSAVCLCFWIKAKGIALFPSKIVVLHGLVTGLFFGTEVGLIYLALDYTLTSRVYVLVYTAPFFAAIQAHFLLENDRLNVWKVSGLIVAFAGVVLLFAQGLESLSISTLSGDMMALGGAALWASTTVYIKKHLVQRAAPLQTLFYQVLFSAPLLFALSLFFEDPMVSGFSPATGFSMFYQCIIVAFLSYAAWFELIHRHPVSLLHAFSFFTPILGVFLSGLLIMGEPLTFAILAAMGLVSVGLVLVNRQPG